uniref:Uncharacterized protein n=1 Tax=Anguilla anguilla TaxID=7936 RepID=A0A0E9UJL8_ANGAN
MGANKSFSPQFSVWNWEFRVLGFIPPQNAKGYITLYRTVRIWFKMILLLYCS